MDNQEVGIVYNWNRIIKRDTLVRNIFVLLFYVALTAIFNWSLLFGRNIMKWDAMDLYYPVCMFSADMLQAGKLPLWNAALDFGTPAYVSLSCLYWYPPSILLRLVTGYSLICVAIEYCTHIVLACFGMFLLAKTHLNRLDESRSCIIAVIIGGFYGFSGLFLSNAEHLTIIISAAWLPYIFWLVKRYFETNARFMLMAAALCMGLSILGGYPEIWVATFIILIPYFLLHSNFRGKIITYVIKTAIAYIVFAVETICIAAVSVIPFIVASKYIGRMRVGRGVNSYELDMVLSSIFSHYTGLSGELGKTLDISMISMFMGLLPILLLGTCFFIKIKYKWAYIGMGCFAFLMMLGNNAFLHPIFHKFFPLFSSLRFPSLWRCILTIFVLLLAAETLESILKNESMIKTFAFICTATGILFLSLYFLLENIIPNMSINVIKSFQKDLRADGFVFFLYAIVFGGFLLCPKICPKIKKVDLIAVLLVIVCVDIFIGQYCLHPLTVTTINQWNLTEIKSAKEGMKERFKIDKDRTHSIEYSDAVRSKSGLDSVSIVLNHTLDEEGYWLEALDYVQNYKMSEHCKLSSEVSVAYITNNVVSKEDVDYNEWISDTSISPYQIYVEQKDENLYTNNHFIEENIKAEYFISGNMQFHTDQLAGRYLVVQQSYYPGWKVYVDGKKEEIVKINEAFLGVYLDEGEHEVKFVFQPLDFYFGIAISLFSILIYIVELVRYFRDNLLRDEGE